MKDFKQILEEAERVSVGSLNGALSPVLDAGETIAVTRYGAVDAYIIPDKIIRELIESKQLKGS